MGCRDRHRHRHDRAGTGRDHRGALVRRAARSGGWNSHRQRRHRTIGVPAAACQHHRTDGLADRAGIDLRHAWRCGLCGADADARSSRRCRPAAIRRRRHAALAGAAGQQRADHGGRTWRAARRRKDAGVLDSVFYIFHLRRQHQRSDPGAFHSDVPRFRHPAGSGGGPACRHGHIRFLRHHHFGLAVGPLRQPISAVLVLRPARPVAVVPAVHQFFVLRPVAVCDVLWSRLDRNRAADGPADRAAVRTGARQPGVRLDLCRPSIRRRRCGVRCGPVADGAAELSTGVLCGRCALHRRGSTDAHHLAADEGSAGGGV